MFVYWINDVYYKDSSADNITIFQKCSQKNIDLPCFCYHESLSIAGNCRMCLVEINTSLKLVVSCAMPMQNNIKIYTSNYRIKKARESVLEFLLVNHPLDCPICDQGGECDLQDITLVYGSDRTRFYEYNKRSVFDKDCGPFVKMIMTRCIHCTRCVRFLNEVGDNYDFGMLNRGSNSEITTYISHSLGSELSGNIIDLCPVGALTSKPFSFTARPWELNSVESIDIFDSMASSIRVDYQNNKVYRILPVYDRFINEDWITNKVRFSYDSLRFQRLYYPAMKVGDKFISLTWAFAFHIFMVKFVDCFYNGILNFIVGDFMDIRTAWDLKTLLAYVGIDFLRLDYNIVNGDFRENFISTLQFNDSALIILLSVNLRNELPLLNSRVTKIARRKPSALLSFFNVNPLGQFAGNCNVDLLKFLFSRTKFLFGLLVPLFGTSVFYSRLLKPKMRFVTGLSFFSNYNTLINNYYRFAIWKGRTAFTFSTLVSNLVHLTVLEVGFSWGKFIPGHNNKKSTTILYNVDDNLVHSELLQNTDDFKVYIGSFFDVGAKMSNLFLPIASNYEYSGVFMNLIGWLRKLNKVVSFPTNVYNSFDLFKSFFILLSLKILNMGYTNMLQRIVRFFTRFGLGWNFRIEYLNSVPYLCKKSNSCDLPLATTVYYLINFVFPSEIYNYYRNDVFSRNSKNLNLASLHYVNNLNILI